MMYIKTDLYEGEYEGPGPYRIEFNLHDKRFEFKHSSQNTGEQVKCLNDIIPNYHVYMQERKDRLATIESLLEKDGMAVLAFEKNSQKFFNGQLLEYIRIIVVREKGKIYLGYDRMYNKIASGTLGGGRRILYESSMNEIEELLKIKNINNVNLAIFKGMEKVKEIPLQQLKAKETKKFKIANIGNFGINNDDEFKEIVDEFQKNIIINKIVQDFTGGYKVSICGHKYPFTRNKYIISLLFECNDDGFDLQFVYYDGKIKILHEVSL